MRTKDSARIVVEPTLNALFRKALMKAGISQISSRIGVSTPAIHRWLQMNNVPWQYEGDFKRILGQQGFISINGNAVRDRDQFYTKRETAKYCCQVMNKTAEKIGVDLSKKHWIEPSAGCGWFFLEFPKHNRTGIDIDPKGRVKKQLIKQDFLLWKPKPHPGGFIVVGNPPFGIRGHLALQFINHASEFADMIGFIVPQLFNSDGKGVAGKRVNKELALAHSEELPKDAFETPTGDPKDIACLFQVWTKINKDKIKLAPKKTCDKWVSIYSLSNGGTPSSTRNKDKIGKCHVYLPSTCYKDMKAFKKFSDLPHKRGYGVIIHKQKRAIKKLMLNLDWSKIAFQSTNSALNLRKSLIQQPLIENGYHD